MLAKIALTVGAALLASSAFAGTVETPASAPKAPSVEAKRGTSLSPLFAKTDLRGPKSAKIGMALQLPAPKTPAK